MAIQHIETLDDPVQSTGSLQWAGQVSGTKPNRIQDDEAAELVNVDLTPDGMLCPRPACRTHLPMMLYSMLSMNRADLMPFNLPGWEMMIAMQRQAIWIWDQAENLVFSNEHVDWGSNNPIPSISAANHKHTSMAQLISVLYVANGGVGVGWLSLADLASNTFDGGVIATFDDDVTALPAMSYVAEHRGRIFAAQKDSDIIWPSSILGTTATGGVTVEWKLTDGIRVGKGEGDPIVALVPSRDNELLVFCRHSVWSVNANPLQTPDNWTITAITRQLGLVGPRAWTWVGNDVWFWSDNGITSVRRVIAGDDQEISPILSYQVQDIIDTVNPAAASTISAVTWKNRVMWAIPTGIEIEPNEVLVYNVSTSHFIGLWRAACHSLTVWTGETLMSAGSSGYIYKWDPESTEDRYYVFTYVDEDGFPIDPYQVDLITAPVESTVRTKSYNWGDFKQLKSPESMEVECWEGAGEMDVMVQLDGQDESPLYPFLTVAEDVSLDVLPRFPLRFPVRFEWNNSVRRGWDLLMRPGMRECREMAVVLKLRGRWRLREIMVNAFINTYEIEI